jgi:hypothetical protein
MCWCPQLPPRDPTIVIWRSSGWEQLMSSSTHELIISTSSNDSYWCGENGVLSIRFSDRFSRRAYFEVKPNGERLRYSCNRPWRPIGLRDVEGPTVSRHSAHRWRWGCQTYTPATLCPSGRFQVFISVRGWVHLTAIVLLKVLGQLKKSNRLVGNQTRDLPACSIVPQPTTLPRAS